MSGRRKRQAGSLLLFLLLCLCIGSNRLRDPRKIYDHARQTFVRGNYSQAGREAETGYRLSSGYDQEGAWRFRLLEAEAAWYQGVPEDALRMLDFSLPASLAQSEIAIQREIIRAGAYIHLHRKDDALESLNRAETLSLVLHSSTFSGDIALARGLFERSQDHFDQADRYFHKSLQFARQRNDTYLEMTSFLNLGTIAEQQGRYDESINWSNEARRLAQVLHDQSTVEELLGNVGWAYYKMGDFDRALDLDQEAEKTAEAMAAVSDQMSWLNNLGLIYYQQNQLSTAEQYYRNSLGFARKSQTPGSILDALTSLSLVLVQRGNLDEAQQSAEEASKLARSIGDRSSELSCFLVKGQVLARRGNQEQAENAFREVINDPKSDLSLRWQAQNDLARLYEGQNRFADADRQYQDALSTVESARASLSREESRLPFLANAAHLYDDYVQFLVSQNKTDQALQFADYSRARTLTEGLGVLQKPSGDSAEPNTTALPAEQIARRANATILFYWLGRKQSYLWAITANRTALYPLPPAEEIDASVQRYSKALLSWQDILENANPDATYLYGVLIEPARQMIPHNSRVIVIADGSLNSLNFETLLAPGPRLHYWIEDATILSASSLRVLEASQSPRESGSGKLLLIGDASSAGPDYAPLPNATAEMENVEKHFKSEARQTYARDRAVPAAYLDSDPGQFSFIHFVAHASASKTDPLDSAIILSQPSAEQDSFKLYARDIKLHPLHADLVTISSCFGAGTKAYTGEGLVGLSWAFLRAGAHNVIGALWEVDDASTATLMDRLYDELKRGHPPDEALRSAKLSLLQSNHVVRRPFYWAPFQLYTGR